MLNVGSAAIKTSETEVCQHLNCLHLHFNSSVLFNRFIMAEEESGPKINIFVKTAKEKKSLEIEESATVKEVFVKAIEMFLFLCKTECSRSIKSD